VTSIRVVLPSHNFLADAKDISLLQNFHPGYFVRQSLIYWASELFPGCKRPQREAEYSHEHEILLLYVFTVRIEKKKTICLTGFNGFRRDISDAVWRILYPAQLRKLLVARCTQRRVVGGNGE